MRREGAARQLRPDPAPGARTLAPASGDPDRGHAPAADAARVPLAAIGLGVALIVALRTIGLDGFPAAADEGGWPLSVRRWVEQGEATFDFYKAPGFHWLLGSVFALFGATMHVARAAATVAGLAGLLVFHRIALRALPSPRQAFVATLVLGTSYAAVLADRRALIEPFLILFMLGACFFAMRRGPRDAWGLALCTAAMLLVKASGIFLLPVLGLAALLGDGEARAASEGRQAVIRVAAGLAGGVALALAVFGALYLADPGTFLDGWVTTIATASTPLAKVPEPGVPHLGRFGIDPRKVMDWLTGLARDEPFLFGLGIAGALRGLLEGRQRTMALWLVLGIGFLLAQTHVLGNHISVLHAPLALLAVWLLGDIDRSAPRRRVAGLALTWPRLLVAGIVAFGAARTAGVVALAGDDTRAATDWVAAHRAPDERVLGAPYLLMRLEGAVSPFVALPAPYTPSPEALAPLGVRWLLVEDAEWRSHAAKFVGGREAFDAALGRCCEPAFRSGAVTVLRVRPAPGSVVRR